VLIWSTSSFRSWGKTGAGLNRAFGRKRKKTGGKRKKENLSAWPRRAENKISQPRKEEGWPNQSRQSKSLGQKLESEEGKKEYIDVLGEGKKK